ncbi:MAG: hypothetical protein AAGF67_05555 [Verrucomicrobiota bacterium]
MSGSFASSFAQGNSIADRLAELKKQADKNGDGVISEAEKAAMRKVLEKKMGKSKGPQSLSKGKDRPGKGGTNGSGPRTGFPEGAKSLFIGHSFFVPVARSFDQLATASDFPEHEAQTVFSPGPGGSPGQLWENQEQRKKIESILATGEIELFGMTTLGTGGGSLDDYRNWIDLALSYNPRTKIMIGQYWMAKGPSIEDEMYEKLTEMLGGKGFEDAAALREEYPNRVYYVHYGHVSSLMKNAFSAGNLPDITDLVGKRSGALFTDANIGHAGPLMHELCAITWLGELYRADLTEIAHSDFSRQAATIARKSIENNEQYR